MQYDSNCNTCDTISLGIHDAESQNMMRFELRYMIHDASSNRLVEKVIDYFSL